MAEVYSNLLYIFFSHIIASKCSARNSTVELPEDGEKSNWCSFSTCCYVHKTGQIVIDDDYLDWQITAERRGTEVRGQCLVEFSVGFSL